MKPIRILDLCCGEGGASMGYHDACASFGIECTITGVDIERKKDYPFNLVIADAVEYARLTAHTFDFIHASPPCQQYSVSTVPQRAAGKEYKQLIDPIRRVMLASGKPGCIENVPFAPIRPDLKLYGYFFDTKVIRQRWFELVNWWMMCPYRPAQVGNVRDGDYITIYGKLGYRKSRSLPKGWKPKFDQGSGIKTWQYAMGTPWIGSDVGISQAIPPAYTNYIFSEFLNQRGYAEATTA